MCATLLRMSSEPLAKSMLTHTININNVAHNKAHTHRSYSNGFHRKIYCWPTVLTHTTKHFSIEYRRWAWPPLLKTPQRNTTSLNRNTLCVWSDDGHVQSVRMRMDFSDIKFNNPIESNSVQKSGIYQNAVEHTIHRISSGIDDLFGNTSCSVQYTIHFHRVNGIYYDGFFFVVSQMFSISCLYSLVQWLIGSVLRLIFHSFHLAHWAAVSLVYSHSFTLAKFPFGCTKRLDILMKSSFSREKNAKHRTQQPMPCISWRINQWINLVIACKIQTMRFGIIKTVQSPNATYN